MNKSLPSKKYDTAEVARHMDKMENDFEESQVTVSVWDYNKYRKYKLMTDRHEDILVELKRRHFSVQFLLEIGQDEKAPDPFLIT